MLFIILTIFLIGADLCTPKPNLPETSNLMLSKDLENLNSFEQMKIHLFTGITKNIPNYSNTSDDWECMQELSAIENGLQESELWAAKIVDAWGKTPPGILDGTVVDFGAFTECFHIDRNGERYETMYCLSQVELNSESFVRRPTNETTLRIGLCVPASCSIEFLQEYFDTQMKNQRNPFKIIKDSCQIEEYPSSFTTLDWIATGILITILILVLMSTAYDILCTAYKRKKYPVFLAFSIFSNGKDLFSCEIPKSNEVIRCLDGIRAITAALIVFFHSRRQYQYGSVHNTANIGTLMSHVGFFLFMDFPIGVDTFFVLSGLLVSMNLLKQFKRGNGKINIIMLYIHRYLRVTPVLAITILFILTFYRFCGSGPVWPEAVNQLKTGCESKWWLALLHVQNYIDRHDWIISLCNAPSWYLSVDTQLYLLSPFIVYLIYRFNKRGICVLAICFFGSVGWTIALKSTHTIAKDMQWIGREFHADYIATYLRCSPWLVGVIAGYIFYETSLKSFNIPKVLHLIAWILSLAVMSSAIALLYHLETNNSPSTPLQNALYYAFIRVGWSVGLCYVIFACHHNYGGAVNWFLGHPLWQPLSRLSFTVYLVHFPILKIIIATTKNSSYLDELTYFQKALGNYVIILFISMIVTLTFETPVFIIEKWVFGPKKKRDNGNRDESGINKIELNGARSEWSESAVNERKE